MCIIAIKPAGIKPPTINTIENMWYHNDDGAGICYPVNGKVRIEKGFMKLKKFKSMLEDIEKKIDTTATPIIYHFRIGTSGGNTAANTHPFPVSDKLPLLQRLSGDYPLVMAHNGMIDIVPHKKNISDTMEYILSQVAPLRQLRKDFYKTDAGRKLLYNATRGKLAFMDGSGHIETVGDFIKDNGMLYSNRSFEDYYLRYYGTAWDDYTSYKKAWDVEPLQWLTSDDGYVILTDGRMDEADGYLMDEYGGVYEYDYTVDMAIPLDAVAFAHNGTELKFDEDLAFPIDIMI